jgi:hypothetical protein
VQVDRTTSIATSSTGLLVGHLVRHSHRMHRRDSEPFTYQVTKDGQVRVSFHGRYVVTVAGATGARLASQLEGADARHTQLLLARATGNFKRGNERSGRG